MGDGDAGLSVSVGTRFEVGDGDAGLSVSVGTRFEVGDGDAGLSVSAGTRFEVGDGDAGLPAAPAPQPDTFPPCTSEGNNRTNKAQTHKQDFQ